ncbi:MAG TPA: malectin domain-containing carbohydrate-binding protein [Phycisphaerae bacterium]|nr:malectin domain-containing carbohydrate-binding protein [Phycisphaerae bacterium]
MKRLNTFFCMHNCLLLPIAMAIALPACETSKTPVGQTHSETSTNVASASANVPTPPVARPTVRIKAGASTALNDSQGTQWSADTGFDGGEVEDRPDLNVTGTPTPELYRSERYGMNSYSVKVPNGAYLLKLHFSEDFDGISSPDDRVFTYAIKDGSASGKTIKEVKNFSPWKAAGAQYKAYVDTVPVTVSSGELTITFTPQIENPQINAIEIVPN